MSNSRLIPNVFLTTATLASQAFYSLALGNEICILENWVVVHSMGSSKPSGDNRNLLPLKQLVEASVTVVSWVGLDLDVHTA